MIKRADYSVSNNNIKNPLDMEIVDKRYCPICGKDMWGPKISDNHYKLRLNLYTGNPCTQVPERKDLTIDMCFSCRNAVYKAIKEVVKERKQE